jgi:hypothetical protein
MRRDERDDRLLAKEFGTYPRAEMISSIRARVSSETLDETLFITRDTVMTLTPASSAISFKVTNIAIRLLFG